MKTGIKRPTYTYILPFLGITIGVLGMYRSNWSAVEYWIWLIFMTSWAVKLLNVIRHRNCFELDDDSIVLRRLTFFNAARIEIADIEKIKTVNSMFKSPKIILKDKTSIKFDSFVDKKELSEFMVQFGIPVL